MKFILMTLLLVSALSAHAIVDEKIVDECKDSQALIDKLQLKADGLEADLDENTIEKLDEQRRPLSASIYLWFKADAYRKDDGSKVFVTATMEKPILPLRKPCF